jgi:hypothetical protein
MRYIGTLDQAKALDKIIKNTRRCIIVGKQLDFNNLDDPACFVRHYELYFDDEAEKLINHVLYSKKFFPAISAVADLYLMPCANISIKFDRRDKTSVVDIKGGHIARLFCVFPQVALIISQMGFCPTNYKGTHACARG